MFRRTLAVGAAVLVAAAVLSTEAGASAEASGKPPLVKQAGVALSSLPLNVRAQIASDQIMNADQAAVTGKPSTSMNPQAAVHDPSFAGFEITGSGLLVSVAGRPSPALLKAIRTHADGVPVTIRTVAHSELQLESLQAKISADYSYWAKRGVSLSAWGPDTASDKISIALSRYTRSAAAELTARYGTSWVTVSSTPVVAVPSSSRTDDSPPWYGGDEIEHLFKVSGGKYYYSICTTGFGITIGGEPYVTTAGHCIEDNFSNSFFNPGGTFGYFDGYTSTHDTMVIEVSGANGVIWSDPTSIDRTVTGVASTDPVGGLICTDGLTNREVCSVKIEATNQTITYDINGELTKVTNTVYACQTSSKNAFSAGDSGGPVETTIGSGSTTARGEVLAYASGAAYCGWYMPERYIESDWGAKVLKE
jgi:hypothetical protein